MRKWKKAEILVLKRRVVEATVIKQACCAPGIHMVQDVRRLKKLIP